MAELRDKRGLTEQEAIERFRAKNYPKPALTADIAVFARGEAGVRLLMIRRGGHPFLGWWSCSIPWSRAPSRRSAAPGSSWRERGRNRRPLRCRRLFP